MDTKTINNFYFSRFIDSLENDTEKWEANHHGTYGGTWTEYIGPEYTNQEGERIRFALRPPCAPARLPDGDGEADSASECSKMCVKMVEKRAVKQNKLTKAMI